MRIIELPRMPAGIRVTELHYVDWRRLDGERRPMRDTGQCYNYLPPRRVLLHTNTHFRDLINPDSPDSSFVWLSRTTSRRLVNEGQILERARLLWSSRRGSNITVFKDNSFPTLIDAARAFAEAVVVFGVSGAGLANIIFCREGTDVVELACPQRSCHYHGHLAAALALRYWWVRGPRLMWGMAALPAPELELLGIFAQIANRTSEKMEYMGIPGGSECQPGAGHDETCVPGDIEPSRIPTR